MLTLMRSDVLSTLIRNWWVVAARGLFGIFFGVLAMAMPGITLITLVALFGAYAIIDGVAAIVSGVHERQPWWALLLNGVAGLGAGLVAFIWPGITALALLYLIGLWAIASGVFQIAAAVSLRKLVAGEVLLGLSGVASLAFGLVLLVRPGAGALGLAWLIGSYAIVFGCLGLALGLRLFSMRKGARFLDAPA